MNVFALRSVLLLGVTLFAAGCFRAPHFEPEEAPLSASNSRFTCEEVMQRRKPVASMKALVDAEFAKGDEAGQFRYAVVSRDVTSLRIDMLPPEGAMTLAILVVHDGVTTLINSQEKTYTAGFDESDLVQRFFGLKGVSKAMVVGLLTGVVPELMCEDVIVYKQDEETTLLLESSTHVVWHVTPSGLVKSVDLLDGQNQKVKLRAKVAAMSSRGLPTISIALYDPYEVHGTMTTKQLTFDQPIRPALFNVEVPSGYTQVD